MYVYIYTHILTEKETEREREIFLQGFDKRVNEIDWFINSIHHMKEHVDSR